jgi:hypothetical protein
VLETHRKLARLPLGVTTVDKLLALLVQLGPEFLRRLADAIDSGAPVKNVLKQAERDALAALAQKSLDEVLG